MVAPPRDLSELPAAYAIEHAKSRFKKGVAGIRDKWSAVERELLRKVVEDPRFSEGPTFVVEQLQNCGVKAQALDAAVGVADAGVAAPEAAGAPDATFLTAEGSENMVRTVSGVSSAAAASASQIGNKSAAGAAAGGGQSAAEGGAAAPLLEAEAAEQMVTLWSRELIRICLEDWDLEDYAYRLQQAHAQIDKLEKEKMHAHHTYLTELQSIRDRMTLLERGTPVEFVIPVGDLIFYEPTAYLETELRDLVKEIVEYKVRQELAASQGYEDKTPELQKTIREQAATIKELKERIKELEEEIEKDRSKDKRQERPRRDSKKPDIPQPRVVQEVKTEVRVQEQKPFEIPPDHLCWKCGGPLHPPPETKVETKAVKQEAKKEIVKEEKVVEKVVAGEIPDWAKDGPEARAKRKELRRLRAEMAETLGDIRWADVMTEALGGGPGRAAVAYNLVKGIPAEKENKPDNNQLKEAKAAMRKSQKDAAVKQKQLEKKIEELANYDRFLVEYTDGCCQTDYVAPPPVQVKEVIVKEKEPVVQVVKEKVLETLARTHDEEEKKVVERVVERPRTPPPPPEPEPEQQPPPVEKPKPKPKPKEKKPLEQAVEKVIEREAKGNEPPIAKPSGDNPDDFMSRVLEYLERLKGKHSEARQLKLDKSLCNEMDELMKQLEAALRDLQQAFKTRLAAAEAERDKLKDENEKLREKNMQLELALNELGEKLREAQQALRDAGLGDIADKIFADVGLGEILGFVGKAICVFDRLYQDALRRLRKHADLQKISQGTHAKALLATLRHIYNGPQAPGGIVGSAIGGFPSAMGGGAPAPYGERICPHCGKGYMDLDVIPYPQPLPALGSNHIRATFPEPSVAKRPPSRTPSPPRSPVTITGPPSLNVVSLHFSGAPQVTRNPGYDFLVPTGRNEYDLSLDPVMPVRGRSYSPGPEDRAKREAERSEAQRMRETVPTNFLAGPTQAAMAGMPGMLRGVGYPQGELAGQQQASMGMAPGGMVVRDLLAPSSSVAALPGLGSDNVLMGVRQGPLPSISPPRGDRTADEVASPQFPSNAVLKQLEVHKAMRSTVPAGGSSAMYLDFPRSHDGRKMPLAPMHGGEDPILHTVDINPWRGGDGIAPPPTAPLRHVVSAPSLAKGGSPGAAAQASANAGLRTIDVGASALPPIEGSSMMPPGSIAGFGTTTGGTFHVPQSSVLSYSTSPRGPVQSPPPPGLLTSASVGHLLPGGGLGVTSPHVINIGPGADLKRNLLEPVRLVQVSKGGSKKVIGDTFAPTESKKASRRDGHVKARDMKSSGLLMRGSKVEDVPPPRS
eukprot:TRINITY_DN11444_c0_g1_i1.p1 TRINITY_DN11444_c0_g1~~TRINITY_DN11444_c0_g1_i1.p1  ORF type:complete len:1310 (-),score=407.96 TRINITY_DN11444_c0_g1_i1:474-4403(-)